MRVVENALGLRECNAIFEARTLHEEIERLKESIAELNEKTISSPCLTGMPHSAGNADRMVEDLIRMEKLQSRLIDKNGKLAAYDKVRSRNSSIRKMTEMALGEARADSPIFVSHGDCDDDVNTVVSIIKEARPDQEVIVNYIGPVIGAHSGYKTIAVYCIGQGRGDARLKK